MGTVRCCPLWHPAHCPMWTVPRVLVRRTESPAHADFVGLSSLAALVVVRLDVVPLPPRSPRRRWRVVGWADILLDVIGGVESALREGCPGTMTGVSQYWFSEHFRQVFSTPMHYPALILAPTCGANRASSQVFINAGARLLCTSSSGAVYTIRVMRHPDEATARWQRARVQQHTIVSANLVQV
jgi:hypothetical protein